MFTYRRRRAYRPHAHHRGPAARRERAHLATGTFASADFPKGDGRGGPGSAGITNAASPPRSARPSSVVEPRRAAPSGRRARPWRAPGFLVELRALQRGGAVSVVTFGIAAWLRLEHITKILAVGTILLSITIIALAYSRLDTLPPRRQVAFILLTTLMVLGFMAAVFWLGIPRSAKMC